MNFSNNNGLISRCVLAAALAAIHGACSDSGSDALAAAGSSGLGGAHGNGGSSSSSNGGLDAAEGGAELRGGRAGVAPGGKSGASASDAGASSGGDDSGGTGSTAGGSETMASGGALSLGGQTIGSGGRAVVLGDGGQATGNGGQAIGNGGQAIGSGGEASGGGGEAGSTAGSSEAGAGGVESTCGDGQSRLDAGACSCLKTLSGAYVIRVDGALYAEGHSSVLSNSRGAALVLNTKAHVSVLRADTGNALSSVTEVQDGLYHGCAAALGSAWCWRDDATYGNYYGQVGSGAIDSSGAVFHASQVVVAANQPLQNVVRVARGWTNNACAITSDGRLYCWGDLQWLTNNGTALLSGYAQPVLSADATTPISGVVEAALGRTHACVIRQTSSGKEVWCWGRNDTAPYVNLGLGDSVNRQYPTHVVGISEPSQLTISYSGGTCVRDGDKVKCWGYNISSETGSGDANAQTVLSPSWVVDSATANTALDGVVELQAADSTFCARRTDRTMWCWGAGTGTAATSAFAANRGFINVVAIGSPHDPRYLTSDGALHIGSGTRAPLCGPL